MPLQRTGNHHDDVAFVAKLLLLAESQFMIIVAAPVASIKANADAAVVAVWKSLRIASSDPSRQRSNQEKHARFSLPTIIAVNPVEVEYMWAQMSITFDG